MSQTDIKAIVRVERPTRPGGPWLAFDQTRRHLVTLETIPPTVAAALGRDPHGHFAALWLEAQQRWHLGERVRNRAW